MLNAGKTSQHPGLAFNIGDIVTPVKKYHPILLRPDPYDMFPNWSMCPTWEISASGIIIEIKIDFSNIGEIMFKIVTSSGTGWVDWWNISRH